MAYYWVYGTDLQRLPEYSSTAYDWSRKKDGLQWWTVKLSPVQFDRLSDLVDLRLVSYPYDVGKSKPKNHERPWSFRPDDVLEK